MSKILEMIEKRNQAWEGAKAFVESKRDKDGLLSTEDAATYAAMEQKVKDYGAEIARLQEMEAMEQELAKPVNTPLTGKPMSTTEKPEKTGRASEAYKQAMLTALRTNFRQVSNVLSEGVDANGGYLVPEEYDHRLIDIQQDFQTSITESSTEIRMDFQSSLDVVSGQVSENQALLEEYIRFRGALIELGKVGNAFTAELSNEQLAFKENGQTIAYISNQSLVITNAEIRNKLSLGNEDRGWFDFIPRTSGNLSIVWRAPAS